MIDWTCVTGFDWDEGNARKSTDKHDVSQGEAEQIFFNAPLLAPDSRHSHHESRYHALGTTDDNRLLHISFTLRANGTLVRIISARDMHRKRRHLMNKPKKIPPKFKTEAQEQTFWESHDSSEYIDWRKAHTASFPNLKPSTKTISLRLSES